MTVSLKKLLGKAGAGLDESYSDTDSLYNLLSAMITTQNDLVAQFNQLRTDYNAETDADHTDTSATAVTAGADIE